MHTIPTSEHLRELARRPGPWVTLSMPLNGGGPLAKGDPIQYRNLARSVEGLLDAHGVGLAERATLLERLERLGRRHELFSAGARGLVVFVSPGAEEHVHLPVTVEATARVDERPFIDPLVPLVSDPTHFYVLVLSQHAVRVLECDAYEAHELALPPATPRRVEDAAGWVVRHESVQAHSLHSGVVRNPRTGAFSAPAGSRTVFHGQGAGTEEDKTDLFRFVRDLDASLASVLTRRDAPVVLAGSDAVQPAFREHTKLPNVLEAALHGNFERTPNEELRARALELVRPYFAREVEEANAKYARFDGTGRATAQLEEVLGAATGGQVETLFVRRGDVLRGTFDPATRRVSRGDGDGDGDGRSDLVALAVTETLLNGGRVHRVEPSAMPVPAALAAILRY
jgi:hypothetical protein